MRVQLEVIHVYMFWFLECLRFLLLTSYFLFFRRYGFVFRTSFFRYGSLVHISKKYDCVIRQWRPPSNDITNDCAVCWCEWPRLENPSGVRITEKDRRIIWAQLTCQGLSQSRAIGKTPIQHPKSEPIAGKTKSRSYGDLGLLNSHWSAIIRKVTFHLREFGK